MANDQSSEANCQTPSSIEADRSIRSEASAGLFDEIRAGCAEVTRRARHVQIDEEGLREFVVGLLAADWPEDDLDPAHHYAGDEADMLAFIISLDAINFGSGWFPVLRKRVGMSGYQTIATACREHFENRGSLSGEELRAMTPEAMARLLGQDLGDTEVAELMALYARAWRDLGEWLGRGHDDRFESVIDQAAHSAERLVISLVGMPLYRDVSSYESLRVPFYKRAQITVADLHRAFGSGRFGHFEDLDRLTLFADNLVPHVLRCQGVLVYADALAKRIDAGDRLVVGSFEEVEIRAAAVEAVERMVSAFASLGRPTPARILDGRLWTAGQAPAIKARPRHRTRSCFY